MSDLSTPVFAADLAAFIDHTALKPDVLPADIERLCEEAQEYGFFSVCVNPVHVPFAARLLNDSEVKVCTVVGFPLGSTVSGSKAYEAQWAVEHGADEIDMVLQIGLLKAEAYELVRDDIGLVVESSGDALVKVILETALLTDEEKVVACQLAHEAGAGFVKTSTGFSTAGATAEDVQLMRETVGEALGVKASGGIRDFNAARTMLRAGASRLGCSASVAILQEARHLEQS